MTRVLGPGAKGDPDDGAAPAAPVVEPPTTADDDAKHDMDDAGESEGAIDGAGSAE